MTAPPDEVEVRRVLNTIIDPCSVAAGAPAGLVDMGLVRDLVVDRHGADVDIVLVIGVTEYGCMIGPSFAMEAYKRLTPLPGVRSVRVDLDTALTWEPDDMSPSYRAELAQRRREGNRVLLPLRDAAHGVPAAP